MWYGLPLSHIQYGPPLSPNHYLISHMFYLYLLWSTSISQPLSSIRYGPPLSPNYYLLSDMVHLYLLTTISYMIWCCLLLCCLPTPMTLASGRSPMFPLVVHQSASPSIWPAVQSLRRGTSTNPGATMWCVCGCSWRDDVCRVCGCYRGGIGVMDVFGLDFV